MKSQGDLAYENEKPRDDWKLQRPYCLSFKDVNGPSWNLSAYTKLVSKYHLAPGISHPVRNVIMVK